MPDPFLCVPARCHFAPAGRGGGGRRGEPPPADPAAAGPDVHGEGGGEDLPPRLAHRVLLTLASQQKWKTGAWRYDGRKNLFFPGEVTTAAMQQSAHGRVPGAVAL